MRKANRRIPVLLLALLIGLLSIIPASANSAEPPGLTVLVMAPPGDLEVTIAFPNREVELDRVRKGWEAYYSYYYHQDPGVIKMQLKQAELIFRSGDEEVICPLPSDTFSTYNNLVTLDWSGRTVTVGQPAWRPWLLVALRVGLTLIIEGAVFWPFGYRTRRSWTVFLLINLATQTGLNAMINGPDLRGYWFLGFVLGEILILLVEVWLFAALLKEREKSRAVMHAITANLVSLWVGSLLIEYLPV